MSLFTKQTISQNNKPTTNKKEFVKHDTNKPRWSLVPWEAMKEALAVLEFGSHKYTPDNWENCPPEQLVRYWDAAMRHLIAHQTKEGELPVDKETNKAHLAHAICCLLFYLENSKKNKDR